MDDVRPTPLDLLERYRTALSAHRGLTEHDPQSNAVKLLAFDISHELEIGAVDLDTVIAAAKALSDQALVERAGRMSDYIGTKDPATALASFEARVRASAGTDDEPVSFERFAEQWSRPAYGLVLTAHPTFAMSERMRAVLADLAEQGTDGPAGKAALETLAGLEHAPDEPLTLSLEHHEAQSALANLQDALGAMHAHVLDVARERYPLQWAALMPSVATLACWVGYDIDGRTDIGWLDSLRLRLDEKHAQLERYHATALAISGRDGAGPAGQALDDLIGRLAGAVAQTAEIISAFAGDLADTGAFSAAANALSADDPRALRSARELAGLIDRALAAGPDAETVKALVLLKSELGACGLGTSHIHLRINAVQLSNAASEHFGDHDRAAPTGRLAMERMTELIAETEPASVNLATLDLEGTTAKRQIMLVAQIIKHIDTDTPIRFLIAESEHPITVLTAIYFAKLFGVVDKVDISPLFETPESLERGGRLLAQLLDNEAYLAYVRARGRLAVQTGFSDAGRFFGQIPAGLAVERLQVLLARHLLDREINDIEVVLFNTHGESMGRGAHPGSLTARQHYLLTPWTRKIYREADIALKHETSFQGGDGFVYFATPGLARMTLCGVIEAEQAPPGDGLDDDPFYTDIAFTWDLYRSLRAYQLELFEDHDYRTVLSAFETNLLHRTGSRRTRRPSGDRPPGAVSDLGRIRAIPHNALLQQLGFTANVKAGLGTAAAPEFERFVDLCRTSERMQGLLDYVASAAERSSITVLAAHGAVFDAGFWIARAEARGESGSANACLALAALLKEQIRLGAISRLCNRMRTDVIALHGVLDALDRGHDGAEKRNDLYLMHAIRLALIMRLLLIAARLPRFATRNDISRDAILDMLLALQVPEALDVLREVFPALSAEDRHEGLQEAAAYKTRAARGYPHLHAAAFEPMERIYRAIRNIGVGLSHRFGAYG